MPEIFKLIYDGYKQNGFWFSFQLLLLFSIFSVIALGFLWIKNKVIEKNNGDVSVQVNVNSNNSHVEEEEELPEHHWKQLSNHSFFRSIQKMINYEIQHLDIKERLRRAIFRDFLLIKFTVIQDKIRDFVAAGDMDKMSPELFHNKLHSLVTEIIQEYEAIAARQGIPDIVITKFNTWHKDKSEVVYGFVNDICEADDWYVSNSVKFYSFLNQMVSILDLTLIDARKTLVRLNGELDKVTYKGLVSEKLQHPEFYSTESGDAIVGDIQNV